MASIFLIIISVLGSAYAFFTAQKKIALGFLILALSFFLAIPNLTTGLWVDVLGALSLVIFLAGAIVIVYKPKLAPDNHE